MKNTKFEKFSNIGYEDFKNFALDNELSKNEKIGFPDDYRNGFEEHILADIESKLGKIKKNDRILDIGPGCSDLTVKYVEKCSAAGAKLSLVDSQEMLDLLPDLECVNKIAGFYPSDAVIKDLENGPGFDKIICYSVFHYIFIETNPWSFLDISLDLLKSGGRFLLADIPNFSMRYRFYKSEDGIEFQKKFLDITTGEGVVANGIDANQIDDGVLLGMMMRARNRGFHAYIQPQNPSLPMSNRREDLLFIAP